MSSSSGNKTFGSGSNRNLYNVIQFSVQVAYKKRINSYKSSLYKTRQWFSVVTRELAENQETSVILLYVVFKKTAIDEYDYSVIKRIAHLMAYSNI